VSEPRIVRAAAMDPSLPHVPVAIVGAGACGLVAAIALRDAGIDCLLLERDATPSGSTALSSGLIPAPGTQAQRAAGIADDSAAAFADDIQNKAHGRAAPHLVAAYSAAVGPAIDALQARHGIAFELLDGFLYPGHRVRRMHALPERTGAALVGALATAAEAAGAMLVTRALVREICCDDSGDDTGRVLGIGYERPDGSTEHLRCDVLLLACNGYGGNAAMVRRLLPEMADATYAGHVGNDGSAIGWGEALGARLADLGGYQGHGSWAVPQGALVSWAVMVEGGVQIDADGRRFHDETQGYSEAAVHVLGRPGGIAWNVFDTPLLDLVRGFPDFRDAEAAGAVRTCAGSAELAVLIGCPEAALAATLAEMAPDHVDRHGRRFRRVLNAPYHAVKVTGALFHTQGGLDIDADTRVLRADGTPLPNLLAAGGAARGVSGDAVWGYLSGNGLLSAVAGGSIAAATAAAMLGQGG
jgi:fumarate reductase flavoprotein subunit